MVRKTRSRAKRVLSVMLAVTVLGIGFLAFTFRQDIQDHFRAQAFDPSPRTVTVVDHLGLTPTGERVFLASRPTIDGSQNFGDQCAGVDHSEEGHVLGCFTGERIHLFDVADERLAGVVEVTAAHELLHATYARLPDGERADLAERLRSLYDELCGDDPELKERMSVYDHLSDASFANELHSVLGTEVRELPTWLETHYARWFADRGSLIDDFETYHAVFVRFSDQAEAIQSEMEPLRADVEQRNEAYSAAVEQFNADAEDFRARNENYEFSGDPDRFAELREELALRRLDLEAALVALQADIDHYNGLRDQLQEISELSTELEQKLDSDLAPITTKPTA